MAVTTPLDAPAVDALRWYERVVPSMLALALVLVALLALTDPHGFLSTDVGGKVATLEAMQRGHTLSPDLGYWAESVDPDGSLYPMWSTAHVGDAWVNVTTLPMLLLAVPLHAVGGIFAAGLLPVAGTVAAAAGARVLARRLGGDGTPAFWIVGLASPLTVYALDFWEHSIGAALMVWAVVLALGASRDGRGTAAALGAGVLFGVAAAMRQEALVYGFVTGAALGIRHLAGGRLLRAVGRGAALAAGFVVAFGANTVLEDALIGDSTRASRSAGTASHAGGDLVLRAKEALVTLGAPIGRGDAVFLAVALVTVVALVELGRRVDTGLPLRPVVTVLGVVGALFVFDLAVDGLGFVPGLVASTPVAALAVTRIGRDPDRCFVGAIALVSLPLVWAVQYTGGAGPQWGGRYILVTGTLLVVLATVTMTVGPARRLLHRVAVAGAVMTLVGVAWTVQRTHAVAGAFEALAARDEPVLVFHDPHLSREGGALLLDEHWLAATGTAQRAEAAEALAALGIDRIGFVEHDRDEPPRVLPGWTVVAEEKVPLVNGLSLRVTTQVRDGS